MIRYSNELLKEALAMSKPIPWFAIRQRIEKRKLYNAIAKKRHLSK